MYICQQVIILLLNFLLSHSEGAQTENDWGGKWFPEPPNSDITNTTQHDSHNIPMGIKDSKCDNAEDNLAIDFDPSSKIDELMYVCLDNETKYESSYQIQPLLREYIIPPAYMPLHKCLNESITYDMRLPTYGTHRPNWPKYGEYVFVPIQRWLHNIEHGAIVMLYHPCANHNEIEKLKTIVKHCLYRHIITASKRLLPERPLALVAWGKSLEMSAVYPSVVHDFIRTNALRGPEKTSNDGQYDKLLIDEAKLVTDKDDSEICPQYLGKIM